MISTIHTVADKWLHLVLSRLILSEIILSYLLILQIDFMFNINLMFDITVSLHSAILVPSNSFFMLTV